LKALFAKALPRFSSWNRARKARFVDQFVSGLPIESVLFVGVGQGWRPVDRIVEEAAARRARLTVGCDLHAKTVLPWHYVRASGLALPFGDTSFDLVVSNAVIEHVGDARDQVRFGEECARVGKHWIITTPNRWFPVESHTGAVLSHWSGRWRAGRGEVFTRLLSRTEFAHVLPTDAVVRGGWYSPTFLAHSRAARGSRSSRP
jgi:SAM-dependent methyltransferase